MDTTTFKGPNFLNNHGLDVTVFFKQTDTHVLLFKTSFHPKHTFAGLIMSQLLRFHRIWTQQTDFRKATKIRFSALSTRGYCRFSLRKCFKSMLQIRPIDVSPLLPVVTTFVRNHFQKLAQDTKMFWDYKLIAAFRRNKNPRDDLIKAKIGPLSEARPRPQRQIFQHRK